MYPKHQAVDAINQRVTLMHTVFTEKERGQIPKVKKLSGNINH